MKLLLKNIYKLNKNKEKKIASNGVLVDQTGVRFLHQYCQKGKYLRRRSGLA